MLPMHRSGPPALVCNNCKSRKRRCDRERPKCSLCTRKHLTCEYPGPESSTPTRRTLPLSQHKSHPSPRPRTDGSPSIADVLTPESDDIQILNIKASPSLSQPAATRYPPVIYLDSAVAQHSQIEIPPAPVLSCPEISALIGSPPKWASIAAEYFSDTHIWMPIISKKRFDEQITVPSRLQLRSDYVLLILCMKLLVWTDEADPRTSEYRIAKSSYLELEIQGIISIQVLQAGILIATYEFGHAIFPSAAISIEGCVRYGQALGIDWDAKFPAKKPFAWVDLEEQNRVWWSIVILDRMLGIGYTKRPFLTNEPPPNINLPSNDLAWDEGIMPLSPPRKLGILQQRLDQDVGRFALAAETVRLLGEVIRHTTADNFDDQLHDEEGRILDRTLHALANVVQFEGTHLNISVMNQTTICSISTLILHEAHLSKHTGLAVYFKAMGYAQQAADVVQKSRIHMHETSTIQPFSSCIKEASPFITTLLYHIGITNLRISLETPNQEALDRLKICKEALRDFDLRWRSSGAYLNILEAREMSSF